MAAVHYKQLRGLPPIGAVANYAALPASVSRETIYYVVADENNKNEAGVAQPSLYVLRGSTKLWWPISALAQQLVLTQLNFQGASPSETGAFNIKSISGVGLQLAQSWIATTGGTLYNQGNGEVKADGTLSLKGATINATGQIIANNGVKFSDGTTLTTAPASRTLVATKTRAAIQAAVDAAKDGDRIDLLSGTYDFSGSGNTLTITKNIDLVGSPGCVWDGGTARHDMLTINSISAGLSIRNIKMTSMHVGTTADNGMILVNELGDVNNLLFENLEITAPVGRYNAISMSAWSEQGNSGCFFRNLTFRNLYIHDIGRMGVELLAHKSDGVPRIIGVLADRCTVRSVGLYNPANSDDVNGMGWSFSGEITNVMMIAPQVHDTLLGLEFVGTRGYQVIDPVITGSRSRTSANGTLINAVGISITDGGQTDRGKPNLRPNQGIITGGRINVTGRPLNTRYADDVLFEVGNWNGGEYVQLQFGTGLKFRRVGIESSAAQFIIYFQQQLNLSITACKWSRETAAINGVHPLYEPVSFDGGCSGNIDGLDIRTIGSPDNIGDGNNRNYLVSNSAPVKWKNLWWNAQRISDNQ